MGVSVAESVMLRIKEEEEEETQVGQLCYTTNKSFTLTYFNNSDGEVQLNSQSLYFPMHITLTLSSPQRSKKMTS